jgi:hypothetical protein
MDIKDIIDEIEMDCAEIAEAREQAARDYKEGRFKVEFSPMPESVKTSKDFIEWVRS